MRNITTPQAILCGLGLIALAIASVPYSSTIVKSAYAASCDMQGVENAIRDLITAMFGIFGGK